MRSATVARTVSEPSVAPTFSQILYGLTVSSNIQLPSLPSSSGESDLTIEFGPFAVPENEPVRRTPVFTLARTSDGYLFDFPDGVRYTVDARAAQIRVSWPPQFDARYAATYLMNVVMALVMRLRGHEVLHASAALIDGSAILIAGPSGAGKSTLAALLALRGFSIITEDVAAIVDRGDRFAVIAAHPRVRLWTDAAELLFGAAERLPLIANDDWKRAFDTGERFERGAFDIAAIYSLDDRRDDPHAPLVEALEGRDALVDLIASSYTNISPAREMTADEFERLGRMARSIPMRLAIPHRDLRTAPKLADAIVEDVRACVA